MNALSPKHVAIIMDGNRRWAENQGLPPMAGHWKGAETLSKIVRAACFLGIETLTVYSFSTENWSRSEEEIQALMHVIGLYLLQKKELMVQDGVRLDMIGNLDRFPESVKDAFLEAKIATAHGQKINLVLALNYGARNEICRAFSKMLALNIRPEEVTEDLVAQHLDTSQWGDPQLLIRTSGELRVSNFLLWQISYAEIFVTNRLWPDFTPLDLLEAVTAYQHRNRRVGK